MTDIRIKELLDRRKEFAARLKDDSLAVIFAGLAKKKSADEDYPFEVNRNFYYLTGIDQDDSVLLLHKSGSILREYLFVSPYDEKKEKWTGKRLTYKEASEASGIKNVLSRLSFEKILGDEIEGSGNIKAIYFDHEPEQKVAPETSCVAYMGKLAEKHPGIEYPDCYPIITNLRLIKTSYEISLFKRAVSATKAAIYETANSIAIGKKEYELADVFRKTANDENGYGDLSFPTIMAAGRNAAVLHYTTLQGTLNDGDLVLMDVGARYGYYCADVSRTFPINGKFDPFQKELYELVLGANKNVISMARPGLSISDLQKATQKFLAQGLIRMGLINEEKEIEKYYFHNVSHLIGLDTHDPYEAVEGKVNFREIPLQAGMIISDEPGIYIAEKNIGIRIEDDLYITESGCVNLTAEIIKEVADIERFMAERK